MSARKWEARNGSPLTDERVEELVAQLGPNNGDFVMSGDTVVLRCDWGDGEHTVYRTKVVASFVEKAPLGAEPPKESRHTSGPWVLKQVPCDIGCCEAWDVLAKYDDDETHDRRVAWVDGGNAVWLREGEAEANARLIAQAPAMYALLCELFAKLEEECDLDSNDRPNWAMRLYRAYGDRARAIATAIEGDR